MKETAMRAKPRPGTITADLAEDIGARAFLFLAEDGTRLGRFLAESGLAPDDLRARIRDRDILAAVLGHVMADEAALLAFAANAGLKPEDVARAEHALGGGSPWESM
jgi:hypothetical protein